MSIFYRSAKHPDFIHYVIEPALVEAEMPTTLAPTVAGLMDSWGLRQPKPAIQMLKQVMVAFGPVSDLVAWFAEYQRSISRRRMQHAYRQRQLARRRRQRR
jgi:hypothetical protein